MAIGKSDFASLHMHSDNSLLDGYAKVDEYIAAAKDLGQKALGLTDHGSLAGLFGFIRNAKNAGLTPVPGCEFYMAPENPEGAKAQKAVFYDGKRTRYDVAANGAYLHMTVWAYNNEGLHNLFKLSTLSYDQSRFFRKPRIDFNLLEEYSNGLVVATGCPSSEISTRFLLGQDDKAYEYAGRLKEIFDKRMFVEIMDHSMSIDLEKILLPKQIELSKKLNLPLLATNDCHYAHKHDASHHEEMLCVQSGARMSDAPSDDGGPRFAFNGKEYYMKSSEDMERIFPAEDYPGALTNTMLLAEMAQDISLDFDPHLKPVIDVPERFDGDEVAYYKYLLKKGMKERYGDASPEVKAEVVRRNKQEFEVIHSSDFIGYMLVVRDYLQWAKKNFSTKDNDGNTIALSIGVGRGCFLPGNMVSVAHKGEVPIEELKELAEFRDLYALTHDGSSKKIEEVFCYDVTDEDCVRITLCDDSEITCTSDHLIMTSEGYHPAKDIKPGSLLLSPYDGCDNHMSTGVKKVDSFTYSGKVYDLRVKDVHNYAVSNITVHNSVGGSIHAFELGISEIDPIKHDLLFERFLSAGRGATYRIQYDDGSTEDLVVSTKMRVSGPDGETSEKYVHQLNIGDIILKDDGLAKDEG